MKPGKLIMRRLREYQKSHTDITYEQIGKRFGITKGAVGHWFTGNNEISLTQYIELCKFLNVDPEKLLDKNRVVTLPPDIKGLDKNVIEHIDLIKRFKDPKVALELNRQLLALEGTTSFKRIIDYIADMATVEAVKPKKATKKERR